MTDRFLNVGTSNQTLYRKIVAGSGKSYMRMCLEWAEKNIKMLEDSL
jgi:hypothetical protein